MSRLFTNLLFTFALLILLCQNSYAQKIDLSDSSIFDFASWVSDTTGKNIILGSGVNSSITVHAPDVGEDQIFDLFCHVVEAMGYSVEIHDGFASVLSNVMRGPDGSFIPGPGSRTKEEVEPIVSQVFKLKYVVAEKVIGSLNSALSSTGISQTPAKVILIDGNSLLVVGSPGSLDCASALVSSLDSPRSRVLIEAIVLETLDESLSDVGVQLGLALGDLEINTDLAGSAGGLTGLLSSVDFSAVVTALETLDNVRLLSTPRILVNDRSSGSVVVGQNVPFVTGQITSSAADVENPLTTIERKDVGVTLSITPAIISPDLLSLVVMQESSSVTTASFASDIVTNARSIRTTVNVAPGEVISIGGLVSHDLTDSTSSVPLLGSIPWIGRLFQFHHSSDTSRKLDIFIKVSYV